MKLKIDAICIACKKQVKPKDVGKLELQEGTNGGHYLHHNCKNGMPGGSMLVWKGKDGVWRKNNPWK